MEESVTAEMVAEEAAADRQPAVETEPIHSVPDILAEGLVKQYGQRTVVNGISLHVNCGEIVGLLGPNGAGKTTTFYMIVGLVKPNLGTVSFRGTDIT